MSDTERAFVWDHSPYKGTAKLIHLKMADLANDTHQRRLWMGDATLAEKASCDERTVRRVKAQMIEDGYLEDLGREVKTGHKEYRFLIPDILSCGQPDRTFSTDHRTSTTERPDISGSSPLVNRIEQKTLDETENLHNFEIDPQELSAGLAAAREAMTHPQSKGRAS